MGPPVILKGASRKGRELAASAAQRVRWFRTFAMNVSQIYDGDGEPVEMKIELEKEAAN